MLVLRIDDILRRKGMTEKELAETLGVSQQSVNAIVRCRVTPTEKKLKTYADALGVGVEDLYETL